MKKNWSDLIINNFEEAANHYNHNAQLQKTFAYLLAKECSKLSIPSGSWLDLGSGTGLLAEALEKLHPNQAVIRVDGSQEMLTNNSPRSKLKLWDLNQGLPLFSSTPSLIASSFALHWLNNPPMKLKEWLYSLTPQGWLAIAVPVDGSFPEWKIASQNAGIKFTAMDLPKSESLIQELPSSKIKLKKIIHFSQQEQAASSLLKPMIKIGAQGSSNTKLKTSQLRNLLSAWPRTSRNSLVNLTWLIQILLVQR